jgi:two-component system, OmpR family, response regulator
MTSRRVLVVDDDRAIVDALTAVLEEEGFSVRTAFNGRDALESALEERPALVLSDIAMPGLDGISLARRLQAEGIPVVLLSAAMPDPGLPGVPFVAKPFDLDRIVEVVQLAAPEPGRSLGRNDQW